MTREKKMDYIRGKIDGINFALKIYTKKDYNATKNGNNNVVTILLNRISDYEKELTKLKVNMKVYDIVQGLESCRNKIHGNKILMIDMILWPEKSGERCKIYLYGKGYPNEHYTKLRKVKLSFTDALNLFLNILQDKEIRSQKDFEYDWNRIKPIFFSIIHSIKDEC